MKIAIIGTGLAGLATGWILTESGCRVTFFDPKGIGQGASGIAAGLLHPYVGEETRRSLWADDALIEAKKLLALVPRAILEEGILRIAQTEVQKQVLFEHCIEHGDVEWLYDNHFLIRSGLVIDTLAYTQGLYQACVSKGATFQQKEIESFTALEEFEHIVVAVGHKAENFFPQVKTRASKVKGQVLSVAVEGVTRSTVAKGYLAKSAQEGIYHWGSTYERNYGSEEPDLEAATAILEKNAFPVPSQPTILNVKAGVRLTRRGHYLPIIDRMEKNVWWIGAFGSRGLLYHALLAGKLGGAILNEDENLIPKECRVNL